MFNLGHGRTTIKHTYVRLSSFPLTHPPELYRSLPCHPQGLAFSVRKGVQVPPSLRNMYKELENEYDDFKAPKHGLVGSLELG